ncbi:hypothetical protein BWI17_06945 [Betaproteobacteria bacterium GR16-43]|nr:hypothetical protein BWI17_06945 [Betaproteobacteria bacterium GR16-43]
MSTWVLLRGLTREARQWGNFLDVFRRAMPDDAVLTPDLPGCGVRHRDASPWSISSIVDSVRRDVVATGAPPPYRVLGLSLGGMIAVEWASRFPGEIDALVLVNTSLAPFSAFHHRLRPRNYLAIVRLALARDARTRETRTLALTSTRGDPDGTLVDGWTRIRLDAPVSHLNAVRQLVSAATYRASREKPRMPVLILTSDGDTLVSSACSRILADRWQAPIAVHPDAGHDLPLDDGAWVAEKTRAWISRRT